MKIYACSTNKAKLREFALAGLPIEVLPNLGQIRAPEETGSTFEENASAKALYYSDFTSDVVLADDSGLEVDALHGAPGVKSARYAGLNATDEDNNTLLLHNLRGTSDRRGRFICVLALAHRGRILLTTRGSVAGEILFEPRGGGGFGYDPLFFYPPLGRSFAELTLEEKFAVSHRGNALRCLANRLPSRERGMPRSL